MTLLYGLEVSLVCWFGDFFFC